MGRGPWSVSGKFPVCYAVMSYSVRLRLDTLDLPYLLVVAALIASLKLEKKPHISALMPPVIAPPELSDFRPNQIFLMRTMLVLNCNPGNHRANMKLIEVA